MEVNDGGPAFPEVFTNFDPNASVPYPDVHSYGGMSLRDYFAGQALQGMLAYYNRETGDFHTNSSFEKNASYAYEQADAMLKVCSTAAKS